MQVSAAIYISIKHRADRISRRSRRERGLSSSADSPGIAGLRPVTLPGDLFARNEMDRKARRLAIIGAAAPQVCAATATIARFFAFFPPRVINRSPYRRKSQSGP